MFSTIAKSGMFGLGMASKYNFLVYSTRFIFLIIRLVPGNVVMVAIDMCGKSLPRGSGYMELREKLHFMFLVYLFISLFNNIFTFLYLQCLICVS